MQLWGLDAKVHKTSFNEIFASRSVTMRENSILIGEFGLFSNGKTYLCEQ